MGSSVRSNSCTVGGVVLVWELLSVAAVGSVWEELSLVSTGESVMRVPLLWVGTVSVSDCLSDVFNLTVETARLVWVLTSVWDPLELGLILMGEEARSLTSEVLVEVAT